MRASATLVSRSLSRSIAGAEVAVDNVRAETMRKVASSVVMRARSYSELLSRRQADRVVIRDGRAIDTTLPDYRELDAVAGLP